MKKIQSSWKNVAIALTGFALCGSTLLSTPLAMAQQLDPEYALDNQIHVPGGDNVTSIEVSQENVRKVLRDLSLQGGFNLVMDDSVNGNVTLSLNKVSINHILQSLTALAGIEIIPRNGNIYLAISKQAAEDKGLNSSLTKIIKIQYTNSQKVASLLNNSIFAPKTSGGAGGGAAGGAPLGGGGGTGGQKQKVRNDPRTNSIIVVGTAREIELAEEATKRLDKPRKTKTFYLSHSNALDIATLLAGSVFNDGVALVTTGGGGGGGATGGGSSGGGSSPSSPSTVRTESTTVQEGTGTASLGGSGGGGGGGGGGTVNASLGQSLTLRGLVKASSTVSISPDGPIIVPDARTNSVTVMGTAEQIAMADKILPILDARVPQVAIEVSLVEISSQGIRDLAGGIGTTSGVLNFGFNNTPQSGQAPIGGNFPTGTAGGLVGLPTVDANGFARSGINFSTNPLNTVGGGRSIKEYVSAIRVLVRNNRAKILANPTVVANHDTESIINIVDEIVRNIQVQITGNSVTSTVVLGEAGVTLDILPKVGEDGTVTLRLRPSVTTIRDIQSFLGNEVTLLKKRDLLTQNIRIRDGETLLVGGLINSSDVNVQDKMPLVGDLPIVGALFRASTRSKDRTEIVLMVTPHIMNQTNLTPTHSIVPNAISENVEGMN